MLEATGGTTGAALLSGCIDISINDITGDGDDGDTADADDDLDEEFALEATAARPGAILELTGIPDELGDEPVGWLYDATVDDPGEDDRNPAFVDVDDEFLFVPPHPSDPTNGGEATIEIVSGDGDYREETIPFEVEPIQPAPGTIQNALADLEDAIVENATSLGYDRQDLLTGDPFDLPAHLGGMAVMLRTLADESYENNLSAVLDGEAPLASTLESDDDGFEIADAMANECGFGTVMGEVADRIRTVEFDVDSIEWFDASDVRNGTNTASLASASAVDSEDGASVETLDQRASTVESRGDVRTEALSGSTTGYDVETLEQLDTMMAVQAEFADLNSGDEAINRKARNLLAGGIVLVPGGQKPASAITVAAFIEQLMIDISEGVLPSELHAFELEADPTDYNEDEFDTVDQTPLGEWNAGLTAGSEGWVFGWDEVVDLIPLDDVVGQLNRYADDVINSLPDTVSDFIEDVAKDALDVDENSGPIEVPPLSFGPVEIDLDCDPNDDDNECDENGELVRWELRHIAKEDDDIEPFILHDDEPTFEPQGVGVSELHVGTDYDAFAGENESADIELEVHPIEVEITELASESTVGIYRLDPDDGDLTLQFEASVLNAEDRSVEWDIEVEEGPQQEPVISSSGDGDRVATFDASGVDLSEHDQAVYRVIASSDSDDGFRDEDALDRNIPERSDTVRVVISDEEFEFELLPVNCVSLDGSHVFNARYGPEILPFYELEAELTQGTGQLDNDGVFEPSVEGTVTIYASYDPPDGQRQSDTVTFDVTDGCNNLHVYSPDSDWFDHSFSCPYVTRDGDDDLNTIITAEEEHELEPRVRIFGVLFEDKPMDGEWDIYDDWGLSSPVIISFSPSIRDSRDREIVQDDGQTYTSLGRTWNLATPPDGSGILPLEEYRGPIALHRRETEINGETVGVYSGSVIAIMDVAEGGTDRIPVQFSFSGLRHERNTDC